ncbi:MAG TPA: hypothetical protein VG032_02470 [Acidimicrobiales bacterium]|nr:hypothetical protein [Acidimicrobiales bacterium]
MNWFFATLPLLALTVASATIPRLVPAVRDQRTALATGRARSNGHGRLSESAPVRNRR